MNQILTGLPRPESLTGVPGGSVYVRPLGVIHGQPAQQLIASGHALAIQGDQSCYSALEVIVRAKGGIQRHVSAVTAFDPWRRVAPPAIRGVLEARLSNIAQAPRPFAGIDLNAPRIMGVVNVTPDSFSDGGDHAHADAAIAHALSLVEAGADILDVGGESTRPGAAPVEPEEEQARVIPVVSALAEKGLTVSIDTRNSATMAAALENGAALVNDVTALTGDAESLRIVADKHCPVVLMHMQGEPQTMQSSPQYDFAPIDVFDFLAGRIEACRAAGIDASQIAVDPGIGFGKTLDHNLELISSLEMLLGLGVPLLVGVSRKSFIGHITGVDDPKARLPGSLVAGVQSASKHAHIVRVHDVAETRQALAVQGAINEA